MPPTQRRDEAGVIGRLLRQPQRFVFFQATRLLDRWLDVGEPDGRGLQRVRFRNSLSLSFPAGEIESIELHWRQAPPAPTQLEQPVRDGGDAASTGPLRACDISHVELTPAFMGLLGVNGTLPLFYTEALVQRELYQKDFAARAFMDIFSHRAVSLFFDAWRKHRLHWGYERCTSQSHLPLALHLAGMEGQATRRGSARNGGARGRTAGGVSRQALAYYAGAIQQRTWSASQIQPLLQDYFRVPVQIEQFVGRWYSIPESGRALLGVVRRDNASLGVLGHSAMLGERVWQRDLSVRVTLGPLDHAQAQRFLPGSQGAKALRDWLTLCCGASLECEVHLQMHRNEIRPIQLNSSRLAQVSRLGWDTFLQTGPAPADRAEVRYGI